jgi:hypothetical protein
MIESPVRRFELLKIPGHAVEVQDHAGTGRLAVDLGPVQCDNLAPGMGLNPDSKGLGADVSREGGSTGIQLPAPK